MGKTFVKIVCALTAEGAISCDGMVRDDVSLEGGVWVEGPESSPLPWLMGPGEAGVGFASKNLSEVAINFSRTDPTSEDVCIDFDLHVTGKYYMVEIRMSRLPECGRRQWNGA